MEAIEKLKALENTNQLKSFLDAIQYMSKFVPKLSEPTDRLRKLLKKSETWKWVPELEADFDRMKPMITEGPCLAHCAKKKDNMITKDASKTGVGSSLWQRQDDGNIKSIAYGKRYLNDTEKNIQSVNWNDYWVCVVEKFRFYLCKKIVYLHYDNQALEPLLKRNRCNKPKSAKLSRWLDRLARFDIAIQLIAGSNLNFTDYRSQNPGDRYDKEYVINTLSEQAKLNLKYGQLFANQSKDSKRIAERKNCTFEKQNENRDRQSKLNRKFENKNDVNRINQSEGITYGQSEISAPNSSRSSSLNSTVTTGAHYRR